jgi:multidrug transporter EmrE-like cation transporter
LVVLLMGWGLGIFYGLLTAAGFGTADVFVTRASRRVGLLAWAFLRERLSAPQIAGIAVILAGVLLVSL